MGHLFLFFVALNREWSVPPWPVFGSLAVVTLATSVTALLVARKRPAAPMLHVGGIAAASLVLTGWTGTSGFPVTGLLASGASRSTHLRGSRPATEPDRRVGRGSAPPSRCSVAKSRH